MHPYATNSSERNVIVLGISALSILLAYSLSAVLTALRWSVPWWLDAPSVVGFFSLLYGCFDRYLWTCSLFRMLGLVKVPNLTGTWKGEVRSGFQAFSAPHAITATITQTWTMICVELRAPHSTSESTVGAILLPKPGSAILTYQYRNQPTADAAIGMHAHNGTATLTFVTTDTTAVLAGEYYCGRDRNNIGQMTLERC